MVKSLRIVAVLLAALSFGAIAAEAETEEPDDTDETEAAAEIPEPASSKTQHQVRIDGQVVKYTATAGWLIMKDEKDKPTARFGYTAYTRDGVGPLGRRPITFAFNGGPGSSSIWLHMGILGPRRVVLNDPGYSPPPPSERVDNEFSVLDVTDIVLIDPVGTGFSKPLGKASSKDFWGVDQDIKSVGAFIKRYVTDNARWASPKYVLGESYGGMRSAGLAHHLQDEHGMNLNGVVLVSPYLNASSGDDFLGTDLPHALYFPTLAATAWYHGAIADKPASLQDYLEGVERFAYQQYMPALLQGFTISAAEKNAMAGKLAAYTGTTAAFWEKADLRVSHPQFLQELKRGERLIAGRIDSRFIGPAVNPLGELMDYDPFFPAIGPAYTAAFLDYLHTELKFGQDQEYRISAFEVEWDWEHKQPGANEWATPIPNTAPDLALAMTMNPGLHVLVQQGWYDLATPYAVTKYDIGHLDITADARKRIRIEYYEAGHMMYLHAPSMQAFRDDLAEFIRSTDRL